MQGQFEAKPYTGKTAFEQWADHEGVPMIRDFIVADLNSNLRDCSRNFDPTAKTPLRGADLRSKRQRGHERVE